MPDPNMSVKDFEALLRYHWGNKPYPFAEKLKAALDRRKFPYHAFCEWVTRTLGPARAWQQAIFSEKVMDAFNELCNKRLQEIAAQQMLRDVDYFTTEMDIYQDWDSVLTDKTLVVSPLFRYLMARSIGMKEVEEAFKDAAIKQALCNPFMFDSYDALMADFPVKREEAI